MLGESSGPSAADLDALARELESVTPDPWAVVRTISDSTGQTTQLVRRAAGDETFIYVRKVFDATSNLGLAYAQLQEAQGEGHGLAHLPRVIEVTREDDSAAVVTELVDGPTLESFLAERGPSPDTALEVGLQLCDAMCELHEGLGQPVIHRDIKPSNIVMAPDRLVLIDLGIARVWHEGSERDTRCLGTPGYAPPEQFGYSQTTVQSDIYAAAMVVAYACTGATPSQALRESGFDHPAIPANLRPVLVRATQLDPAVRYASAREMAQALSEARPSDVAAGQEAPAPSHVRVALGIVWNVALSLALALVVAGSLVAAVQGLSDVQRTLPLVARIAEYAGMVMLPAALLAFALADKSMLRQRFGWLRGVSSVRIALVCVALAVALVLLTAIAHVVLVPR